jgi:hypothetical protein
MRRSVDAILTTHTGSLARTERLTRLMWALQDGEDVGVEVAEMPRRGSREAAARALPAHTPAGRRPDRCPHRRPQDRPPRLPRPPRARPGRLSTRARSHGPQSRTSLRRAPWCLGTRSAALLWNEPPQPRADILRCNRERSDRDGPPPSHTTRPILGACGQATIVEPMLNVSRSGRLHRGRKEECAYSRLSGRLRSIGTL